MTTTMVMTTTTTRTTTTAMTATTTAMMTTINLLSANYDEHPGNNFDYNSDKTNHIRLQSTANDNNYRVILTMTIATTATMFAVTIIRMTTAKTMTTMTKATITKIIRLGGGIATEVAFALLTQQPRV